MTVAKSKEKSKGQSYVLTQDRGPEDRNSVTHAETSCTLPFFRMNIGNPRRWSSIRERILIVRFAFGATLHALQCASR